MVATMVVAAAAVAAAMPTSSSQTKRKKKRNVEWPEFSVFPGIPLFMSSIKGEKYCRERERGRTNG